MLQNSPAIVTTWEHSNEITDLNTESTQRTQAAIGIRVSVTSMQLMVLKNEVPWTNTLGLAKQGSGWCQALHHIAFVPFNWNQLLYKCEFGCCWLEEAKWQMKANRGRRSCSKRKMNED